MLKLILLTCLLSACNAFADKIENVVFIISDDLSSTALGCYGNTQCKTPNIDKLADSGMLFSNAYCQYPVCGASRSSMMSGMYPHSLNILGNKDAQLFAEKIANRPTLGEALKNSGVHTARVGKIYHMKIPGDITAGVPGPDHAESWSEFYDYQGNEWFTKGRREAICKTPLSFQEDKHYDLGFGIAFYSVAADRTDDQPDYYYASKAVELIGKLKEKPFFLAVGLIRPHVPLVAPKKYFDMYKPEDMVLPKLVAGDLNDIPKAGIFKSDKEFGLSTIEQKKKILAAYYASTTFMDDQVGRILKALEKNNLHNKTAVIFTSDHGWNLGEHTFWQKMNLHEESVKVPMIIKAPGVQKGKSKSLSGLIDIYPTICDFLKKNKPAHVQGKSLRPILKDKNKIVRNAILSVVNQDDYLIRTDKWAYMQYGKNGERGHELYNMLNDPKQYENLASNSHYVEVVKQMKTILKQAISEL